MKINMFILLMFSTSVLADNKHFPNFVDYKKFSGTWFEIARTYNSFQDKCMDSYVKYLLDENNRYDIRNICSSIEDNSIIDYKGVGKSLNEDKENFSKIKMTYFYIFSKNYNVIYNDNYKIAIISDEDYENIWIMSRTKEIPDTKLKELLKFIEKFTNLDELIFEAKSKNEG